MEYINKYATSQDVQNAVDNQELSKPYVAYISGTDEIDFNSLEPTPVETRLKITYNFETTDETLVLANMRLLFHDAPGKAEFPDGTEFIYDPDGEYETSDIKYTPSTPGIASIYYTFTGDTIGPKTLEPGSEFGPSLLHSYEYESDEGVPAISIEIPDQVNTIGAWAFSEALYSAITIPNHSLTIGYGAFYCGSYGLGQLVSINNGENTIPSGSVLCGATFAYQDALEEITIGQGVTFELDAEKEGDFEYCSLLSSITFLDTTPPSVNDHTVTWAWSSLPPLVIHVPVGSENAYVDSFNQGCSAYAFRYVSPGIIEGYEIEVA